MMIAHLPSGYLLGRLFRNHEDAKLLLAAGLVGAMAPDIDMLAFLLDGSLHHHAYPTHWPFFWVGIGLPVVAAMHLLGYRRWRNILAVFLAGTMIHMVLDSVAAPLYWLRPFGEGRVELIHVPANYSHWIISMFLHWSFLLEVAIIGPALFLLVRDVRKRGG